MCIIYKVVIIFGILWQGASTLRLLRVVVPAYKIRGETALLECVYEMNSNKHRHGGIENVNGGGNAYFNNEKQYGGGDNSELVYSVKWYKDNVEFYRYMPTMKPAIQSFKIEGVRVEHQLSNSKQVTLKNVNLKSTGIYRCEVSAEGPSFNSVQGEGRMDVVYLPKDGPHITGDETNYQIGDTLSLNCTSGKSHPATILSWFINDEQVLNPINLIQYTELTNIHGLKITVLGLEITVESRLFKNGAMRVRCLASLPPVLWKGSQGTYIQSRQEYVDNREAMLLVRSHCSSTQSSLVLVIIAIISTVKFYM